MENRSLTVADLKRALEFYADDVEVVVPFHSEPGVIGHEAPDMETVRVDCQCGESTRYLVIFPPSVSHKLFEQE